MDLLWRMHIFVIGTAIGSFLNVLIDRLPKGQSVIIGRSHCDHCRKILRWYELIPVVSYLYQRGACLRCRKSLSLQYPVIELTTGVGFLYLYSVFYASQIITVDSKLFVFVADLVLFAGLLSIFVADLKTQIIPDSLVIAVFLAVCLSLTISQPLGVTLTNNLEAAIIVTLFFYLLWFLTGGRGMGFGDVKLVFVLGLLIGFPGIIITLYIAFLTGAFLGVILIFVRAKSLKSKIPFGPFLLLGTLVTILWQNQIIEWWKGLI